jgi:hypothetical protein
MHSYHVCREIRTLSFDDIVCGSHVAVSSTCSRHQVALVHLRQSVRPSFLTVEHFPCPTLGTFPRTSTHSTDSLKRLSPCLHSPPSLSVHTTHVTTRTHAHTHAHTLWHTHTGQDTIRCSEFDKSIQDLLSRTQGVCSAGRSLCLMLVSVCVHVCVCVYL